MLSAGLTETCRECGQRSLEYLDELKDRQRLSRAELGDVRGALQGVLQLAQVGDGSPAQPPSLSWLAGWVPGSTLGWFVPHTHKFWCFPCVISASGHGDPSWWCTELVTLRSTEVLAQ